MKKITYLTIFFVIIFTAFTAISETIYLTNDQIAFIQKLVNENFLKLKPELNKAYIDPDLWNSMNI